jgi:hypothetical protein
LKTAVPVTGAFDVLAALKKASAVSPILTSITRSTGAKLHGRVRSTLASKRTRMARSSPRSGAASARCGTPP